MSDARAAWIVGATSVLGYALARASAAGLRIVPVCSRHSRSEATAGWRRIDVEKPASWQPLRAAAPEIVIYAAGVCDVARCEDNPEFAWTINVGGIEAMLDAVPDRTRIVVVSSDHVFAGREQPYVESSEPDAVSVYGHTRIAAEARVRARRPDALVIRVALPIGPSPSGKVGHQDWLRYRTARGLPMTVIDGEHRAAVRADDAAARVLALAKGGHAGVRHLAATRAVGRPELAAWLCESLELPHAYTVRRREELEVPHLGRVDLQTELVDDLAQPLPSAIPHGISGSSANTAANEGRSRMRR